MSISSAFISDAAREKWYCVAIPFPSQGATIVIYISDAAREEWYGVAIPFPSQGATIVIYISAKLAMSSLLTLYGKKL